MGKDQPGRDKRTFGGGIKSRNILYLARGMQVTWV